MNENQNTSIWATKYTCTNTGDWSVTQGQADYCEAHGHAFYELDGEMQDRCPRCGANTRFVPTGEKADAAGQAILEAIAAPKPVAHEFDTNRGRRDSTGRYFARCTCGKEFSSMVLGDIIRRMGKHFEEYVFSETTCSYCSLPAVYVGEGEDGDFYCEGHTRRAPGSVRKVV